MKLSGCRSGSGVRGAVTVSSEPRGAIIGMEIVVAGDMGPLAACVALPTEAVDD